MSKPTASIVQITGLIIGFILFGIILLPTSAAELTSSAAAVDLSSRADSNLLQFVAVDFNKDFTPGTIGPGSISTLEFSIDNPNGFTVTDLSFFDNLPPGVLITAPSFASTTCTGGILTAPDGGDRIDYSGGEVGGDASCTISVNVTSIISSTTYTNVSGNLITSITAFAPSGNATANLIIDLGRPGFNKGFVPSLINPGDISTLNFTIDNRANLSPVNSLAFTDDLPTGVVIANPANISTGCAGGTLEATQGEATITYNGGAVLASTSCTLKVDVTTNTVGTYLNATSDLTSSAGNSGFATGILKVIDPISLQKSFTDDPVAPGDTVMLEFTVTDTSRSDSASGIAFTDNLGATLAGLTAIGLPSNPCGAGSELTGTSVLSFSGGSLAPEASCTFSVTLQLPASTTGIFTNTTSTITGMLGGTGVTGSAATDFLVVEPAPRLTKEFTDDPVAAGGTVTIRFTLTNTSASDAATNISFSDTLFSELPSPDSSFPATGLCNGATAFFTPAFDDGPAEILVIGANLSAGESCNFSFVFNVAPTAAPGIYLNITSEVTADVGMASLVGKPASDDLSIVAAPILSKSFTDDPVAPGDTVNLEFTLTNSDNSPADALAIAFSDVLDTTLAGFQATGTTQNDICGSGSKLSGTSTLSFTGGSLTPGASCTFSVSLLVPASTAVGTYTNTTSSVMATVLGKPVTENPALDEFVVANLTAQKSFTDDPAYAGGTVNLEFTLNNTSLISSTSNISFTDDLESLLSGLVATNLPLSNICGAGSLMTGTSVISFTGGNLAPASSCTWNVTLLVPDTAALGEYDNLTSPVTADLGSIPIIADPAVDKLTVTEETILYMPIIFKNVTYAPDLVVTALSGSTGNLQVVLQNQGNANVVNEFWVDVYIDPTQVPTAVNETWPLQGANGLVWGVTSSALPIVPSQTITLTLNDTYYAAALSSLPATILPGTPLYAQVDSAAVGTTEGSVLETHEISGGVYNNILGPVAATSQIGLLEPLTRNGVVPR